MSVTSWTFEHYNRPEIKQIILSLSKDGAYCRCGNGDTVGWYKHTSGKKELVNLSNDSGYDHLISKYRTLYWSLNYFDDRAFEADYNRITPEERPIKSREFTRAYSFGVDIDTIDMVNGHGSNIEDPEIKEAVELMAQYYCDRLREHAPNSVHVLFSGGGIYVLLHHKVFKHYFDRYSNSNEWEGMMRTLIDAMNSYLDDISKDFAKEYPEHTHRVKADIINNSKRMFKSIFSIHAEHHFAVIPLNPDNVIIDFEKASLPLKDEVIETGRAWYQTYDTDNGFLRMLKPYLEEAHRTKSIHHYRPMSANDISDTPIEFEHWPPCIKNILSLESCGEGRTRALALLAAFLGQMAVPEDQAKDIFYGLARRWGATTSNIFESYYSKMHVPTCENLRSDRNVGFPSGCSIKLLDVCKPDSRCLSVPSPRYYADREANAERLKSRLTDKCHRPSKNTTMGGLK